MLLCPEGTTISSEHKLTITIEKNDVPELVRKLVMQNIKIYSVTEDILTLEDAFLKKTGGNIIE